MLLLQNQGERRVSIVFFDSELHPLFACIIVLDAVSTRAHPRVPCVRLHTSRALRALRLQCSGGAVQDSGAVELGSASAHDPEINVFNLDEGGDQRGPHSLAGQLSIGQELQMHSLDSDTAEL